MEKTILVVGEDNLQLYRDACDDPSIEFKTSGDLRTSLEIIREKAPDLLILDHEVLGHRSLEICQTLKKYPATQRIPQLFVVPKTAQSHLLEVLFLPIEDYVFLPLDAEDFKLRVRVQLDLLILKDQKKLLSVEEKIEELAKLLEIFPDYNAARQELAEIYERTERVEDALNTLLALADSYHKQNNYGLAMDVITRMKRMLAEKSTSFSGGAQFSEALERCQQILGKEK